MKFSDSSSDSETDFFISNGDEGYLFEPEFTEAELEELETQAESESTTNPHGTSLDWCTCKNCVILPKEEECMCCNEFGLLDHVQNHSCVVFNHDFSNICLNETVLETAYISFLRYKRHRGRAPETLTNRQYRLMAYRQFVCWVCRGQPLGRRNRIPLPACVVNKIRMTFPDESGIYEGFQEYEADSDSD